MLIKTGFKMLLAPQIILNSLPTVQSNKSISGVMAEGDLWAIHALYLIVIVNPRFKASLQLTGPRTASAVTKSGAYYCPGIHTTRMLLHMKSYIPPNMDAPIEYVYGCMCIVHPRQNLTTLEPNGREKRNTQWLVFKHLLFTSMVGGRVCPHTPFPVLLSDTVGQHVFLVIIFSLLFYSKKWQPTPDN